MLVSFCSFSNARSSASHTDAGTACCAQQLCMNACFSLCSTHFFHCAASVPGGVSGRWHAPVTYSQGSMRAGSQRKCRGLRNYLNSGPIEQITQIPLQYDVNAPAMFLEAASAVLRFGPIGASAARPPPRKVSWCSICFVRPNHCKIAQVHAEAQAARIKAVKPGTSK